MKQTTKDADRLFDDPIKTPCWILISVITTGQGRVVHTNS